MKYLIVNGDDFGASPGINRGIIEAHRRGILTSASLLVDSPWSEEAAALGRAAPLLSVGLHVDLANHPATPAIAARGSDDCRSEMDRQLRRFEELTGGSPTHLDSHHNVHRARRLLRHFLEFARQNDLPLREHSPIRCFTRFYGQWGGEDHLEHISAASLARMLATELAEGITEMSCHPGYADADLSSSYTVARQVELQTLCNPAIRRVLAEHSIQLINHREAAALLAAAPA